MTRARGPLLLALATALAWTGRSFGQEPALIATPSPSPVAVASPATETPAAGPSASTDAAATLDSRSPDFVGELGTFEETPGRSCFGEALVGYYRSSSIGPRIPNFDYVPIAFRLGYRPWEDRGYIASRISLMAEVTVDPITASFGNYMTGASLMVRYDVCPDRTVCPYFQGGTGFVLTDAWRDRNQGAIGEEFEFLQQLQVGVRWKLSECLAIEAECGLQHVSNGGLARHNLGANDLGGSIGLRWTFGGR